MLNCVIAIQRLYKSAIAQANSPLVGVKTVYAGDPDKIAELNLPAITIAPEGTEYSGRGSRYDEKKHRITVRLVYNVKDLYEKNQKVDEVESMLDAMRKTELTSGTTQSTANNTLVGVLRRNPTLPLTEGGVTFPTAHLCEVQNAEYRKRTDRSFPTYEVALTLEVTAIGDRI